MRALLFLTLVSAVVYVQTTSDPLDLFLLSNNAIEHCAKDNAEQEKMRELVVQPVLPEDDEHFTKFFECYYRHLGILDKHGNIDFVVVRAQFPEVIRNRVSANVDVEKLANEAIEHCDKEAISGSAGLRAIKRRNCGDKYVREHAD